MPIQIRCINVPSFPCDSWTWVSYSITAYTDRIMILHLDLSVYQGYCWSTCNKVRCIIKNSCTAYHTLLNNCINIGSYQYFAN